MSEKSGYVDAELYAELKEKPAPPAAGEEQDGLTRHVSHRRTREAARRMREQAVAADEVPRQRKM